MNTDQHCLAAEMDNIVQTLLGRGLCNKVHYKELYLPREEIEGGHILPSVICMASCHSLPISLQATDLAFDIQHHNPD